MAQLIDLNPRINPPYGDEISIVIEKISTHFQRFNTSVTISNIDILIREKIKSTNIHLLPDYS